jgi:transposase-like protein
MPDDEVGNRLAFPLSSSDCDQIPHAEKLTELPRVYKQFVGNRKTDVTLTKMAAMNRVQFQSGLSLTQFMERYATEAQCEVALEKCRWRDGFVCPMCARKGHYVVWHGKAKTFQCHACRHQTTLTSGTIFHSSKLPLTKWFHAMYFLTQSKNNVSALELMRVVGFFIEPPG